MCSCCLAACDAPRRVIHRDLKPENILMEGSMPKIADFGLAGVMAPVAGGSFTLQCGTPEFSAPEIVGGREYEGPAVSGNGCQAASQAGCRLPVGCAHAPECTAALCHAVAAGGNAT